MAERKEWAPAPEVAEIAARLIELFHPHLHGVRIEYVFVSTPPIVGGEKKAAVMRKVSGLYAFLATPGFSGAPEPFFVMEVCHPVWVVRPAGWRVACVDHELKHAGYDDEQDTICIVPHDSEEFDEIAERHGAWHEGLERFGDALERGKSRQAEFNLEDYEGVKRAVRRKTKRAPDQIDLRRSAH